MTCDPGLPCESSGRLLDGPEIGLHDDQSRYSRFVVLEYHEQFLGPQVRGSGLGSGSQVWKVHAALDYLLLSDRFALRLRMVRFDSLLSLGFPFL